MTARRIALGIFATILAGTLALLLAHPRKNGPSAMEWMGAMIQGRGKPHYLVSGTVESRMDDFLRRHPQLQPAWREVPDAENRYLRLREFVHSSANANLKPDLAHFLSLEPDSPWDAAAAAAFLDTHRKTLDELRSIAALTEFSTAPLDSKDLVFYQASLYKQSADALHVSLRQNLHTGDMDAAFRDFEAIYRLAATLDQHEVANLLSATVALLFRKMALDALQHKLADLPASTDWSRWIRIIENEPAPGPALAHVIRGEAWCSTGGLILPMVLSSGDPNPIWNFPAFEDGFAKRMIERADAFETASVITPADLVALEARWMTWETGLGKDAREMLKLMQIGQGAWLNGYFTRVTQSCHILAALQLLEIERTGGPVLRADDPRLAALAIDPVSGSPFPYDPERRVLGCVSSSEEIQLPPATLK